MSGKIIVIEGIDGAGKTTQTNLLVDWIRHTMKREVVQFDFPGYSRSIFGKILGKFLKGEFGNPVDVNPFEVSLLYAGDRLHSKHSLIRALLDGKIVIINRYVPSNLAYGCAKMADVAEKDKFIRYVRNLEYDLLGLPPPDLVLVLDITTELSNYLISTKKSRAYLEGEARDEYEKNMLFQEAVRKEYLYIAENTSNWTTISCTDNEKIKGIEEIQQEIRDCVSLFIF